MKKLLLLMLTIFGSSMLRAQCPAPSQMTVTSITGTTAMLSWTENGVSLMWDVIVLPGNAEGPSPIDTGWVTVSANPYIVVGLGCETEYKFYIRSRCGDQSVSEIVGPFYFVTYLCGGDSNPYSVCDNGNDGVETINLTDIEPSLLSQLPTGNYSFSYHLTQADAENEVENLPDMFTNTSNPQTIFIRIKNTDTSTVTIQLADIILNPAPIFPDIPVQVACSESEFASFDLGSIAEYIWMNTSENPNSIAVDFFTTEADAEANANSLPWAFYTMTTPNQQILYISLTNTMSGCRTVGQLVLESKPCAGIKLVAFVDQNGNGTRDSGEPLFPFGIYDYEMNNDGVSHSAYTSIGEYVVYDNDLSNTYNLTFNVFSEYLTSYTGSTAIYENVTLVQDQVQTFYFPVTSLIGNNQDLEVMILEGMPPRPGFPYYNFIQYKNNGSTTMSGTINFNADPTVSVISADAPGAIVSGNTVSLAFTNLAPFETRHFWVTMQVPVIPIVQLGDIFTNAVSISPLEGDGVPANNSASLTEVIVGSYDPNDKAEAHGPQIAIADFTESDYLVYTIRFENTGTADAIDVSITDVLDGQLDPTTVRMVAASHDYVMNQTGNNITWRFENILLPAAEADPLGAQGFVTFKVKPNPGFEVGDIIPNTAEIYFDFNPAIVTNTWTTQFVPELGTPHFNSQFVIYPNPVQHFVSVSLSGSADMMRSVQISDMLGKTVFATSASGSATTLDTSSLSSGIYLLEVQTHSGKRIVKKLVKQ